MAQFFIHRPIFAWVLAIVIMLAGALAVLTLPVEQFPVDPEQRSQQPAAHRQLINIILLKKTQIHASYGYHRQSVSSHGSRNGSHP